MSDTIAAGAGAGERVLGFDLGTRIIGVAVGESLTASARPLASVAVRDGVPDWTGLERLVGTWLPDAMVVGLPLTLDGSEQAMSRRARRFAGQLGDRFERPVHLCDERYTSREAAARFADARRGGRKRRHHASDLDAMAAAVILETWFATRTHAPDTTP